MRFGRTALRHPLVVEAIETAFHPVAIHNNKPGRDAEVLARFAEPSWNNPVVRFVDAKGKDLIPRKDGVWTTAGLVPRMVAALEAAGRPVPPWLESLHRELAPVAPARLVLAMHCFWEGEGKLGGIDGVLATRAAFLDGREVVEVRFDGARIGRDELVEKARALGCAAAVYGEAEAAALRPAPASDQKHTLRASPLRFLPLTPLQAARVNAALHRREDPAPHLSPRQAALAERVRATLAKEPGALEGLEPPEDHDALADYVAKLESRVR